MSKETVLIFFQKKRENLVNIKHLARNLWNGRNLIARNCLGGLVVGFIICLSLPKEYKSTILFVVESEHTYEIFDSVIKHLELYKGLDTYTKSMYPIMVEAPQFVRDLLDIGVPAQVDGGTIIKNLAAYLDEDIKVAWWSELVNYPKKLSERRREKTEENNINKQVFFSPKEIRLIEMLQRRIFMAEQTKTGIVELSVTTQDPVVSAIVADSIVTRLERQISTYRMDRFFQNYDQNRLILEDALQKYYNAQENYAVFLDANKNLATEEARIELKRLIINYDLAFQHYTAMSTKLQLDVFNNSQKHPAFFIISPANIALKASMPNRLSIMAYCLFLSFFFSCVCLIINGVRFSK